MDFVTNFYPNDCTFNVKFGEIQESSGGTTDYEKLQNRPSINGATLTKGMRLADIGIRTLSNTDLEGILK